MNFEVLEDRRYLETHEWVSLEDGVASIGITDFAQDELGDVVYVELPSEGEEIVAGKQFGTIESIKAVSDVYAPVGGTVTAVNDDLTDQPELVNEDPFGDGWMIHVDVGDVALDETDTLTPEEYRETIA